MDDPTAFLAPAWDVSEKDLEKLRRELRRRLAKPPVLFPPLHRSPVSSRSSRQAAQEVTGPFPAPRRFDSAGLSLRPGDG